ncbi:MAG TPA: hypothetical protein VFD97_05090 [Acidimicrobiia bacterium]|nr:hypothetical protein [Acidimicrobiia bacterium]
MSDDIKGLFQTGAPSIPVPPRDLPRVIGDGRRRLMRRRAASVSSAVVIIGAIITAVTQISGGQDRTPVASENHLVVVERVPLRADESGDFARDLTYGFGSIWVLHARDATLQRIDPNTNKVDRVIALDEKPGELAGFWDVEAGFDLVWITDPQAEEVIGVDPASEKIVARIQNVGRPLAVFIANDALWVHSGGSAGEEMLYRIDPATLEVTGSLGMGGECCIGGIVESDGYLWVSYSDIPSGPREETEEVDDMVFDLTNEIRKVDPNELAVVETIPLAGDTYRPGDTVLGDLLSAEGYLWSTRPTAGYVDRIDPSSGRVESVELNRLTPSALIHFEGSVWAWDLNGSTLVPIDPLSLKVGDVSDMKEVLGAGPVEGAGSLWVASQSEDRQELDSILRIDTSESVPVPVPSEPEETMSPTPEEPGIDEAMSEQEQAEVFAFRAVADTGLMDPFGKRSYLFTYVDDTTETDSGWRIGFAASDCEPRKGTITCRGLSGEDPDLGNALTDTYVTVGLSDGQWQVTDVDGNMLEDERGRLIGYTLPERKEASHWEFPAIGVWPGDDQEIIEMMALWVGPYPTTAPGSVCNVELFDGNDNPVGEPWVFYQEPPNRPFERAGWIHGRQLEPAQGVARGVVNCHQRTGSAGGTLGSRG